MELAPLHPHHALDQLSYIGLSFSALGCPYMGDKWIYIKVMIQGRRTSRGMSKASKRIERKELLTLLEVQKEEVGCQGDLFKESDI